MIRFFKLKDIFEDSNDAQIKNKLEEGLRALRKEHDELEKPLKEAGIISGKDKKIIDKRERKSKAIYQIRWN